MKNQSKVNIIYICNNLIQIIILKKELQEISIINFSKINLESDIFNNPLIELQIVLKNHMDTDTKSFLCLDVNVPYSKRINIENFFININIKITKIIPNTFATYYSYKHIESDDINCFKVQLKKIENGWIDLTRIENCVLNGMILYILDNYVFISNLKQT